MILPDRLSQKVLYIGVGKGNVQSNFNTIRSVFFNGTVSSKMQ